MSDRRTFLKAIHANPDDMLPRLVFADWLDDNGEGDKDAATAEFVRLGCRVPRDRITADEGRWLDSNWRRLVPTLAGVSAFRRRSGRWVYGMTRRGRCVGVYYFRLEFFRGFVRTLETDDSPDVVRLAGKLHPDQPLAEFDLSFGVHYQYDTWTADVPPFECVIPPWSLCPGAFALLAAYDRVDDSDGARVFVSDTRVNAHARAMRSRRVALTAFVRSRCGLEWLTEPSPSHAA